MTSPHDDLPAVLVHFGHRPVVAAFETSTVVPIPVGRECFHCTEKIALTDDGTYDLVSTRAQGKSQLKRLPVHLECHLRAIVGGLRHVLGACCCALTSGDDDTTGLTDRNEARLVRMYLELGGRPHLELGHQTP